MKKINLTSNNTSKFRLLITLFLYLITTFKLGAGGGGTPGTPVEPSEPLCDTYGLLSFDLVVPANKNASDYPGGFHGISVKFIGNFTIDNDFEIKDCVLDFEEATCQIIINSAVYLRVEGCEVFSCTTGYRFFADGVSNSRVDLVGNIFQNINELIHFDGVYFNIINNLIELTDNYGIAAIHILNNSSGTFSGGLIKELHETAILLENCNNSIQIGTDADLMTFDHNWYPVNINHCSSVYIRNVDFNTCNVDGFLGTAVQASSSKLNLTVTNTQIEDTPTGFNLGNVVSSATWDNCNFSNVDKGIKCARGKIDVKNTTVNTFTYYFINSTNSDLTIDNTILIDENNYNPANIGVNLIGGNIMMQYDSVNLNNGSGFVIQNATKATLNHNIFVSTFNYLNNVSNGSYLFNNFYGSADNGSTLRSTMCHAGNFCSNNFSYNGDELFFSGNCDQTWLIRNAISNTTYGITITEVIGVQDHFGNTWDNVSDNGIQLILGSPDPKKSLFIVNSLLNSKFLPTSWDPSDIVSDVMSGSTSTCLSHPDPDHHGMEGLTSIDTQIVTNVYSARDGSLWEAQKRIMKKAILNPSLLSNTDLDEFYSSTDTLNTNSLNFAKSELLLDSFNKSYRTLKMDTMFNDLKITSEQFDSVYLIYISDITDKSADSMQLLYRGYLDTLIQPYSDSITTNLLRNQGIIDSVQIILSDIMGNIGKARMEKRIDSLICVRLSNDTIITLNSTDSTLVNYVSSLCPLDYGSMVYSARSFLDWDNYVSLLTDSCIYEEPIIITKNNNVIKDLHDVYLYPNPTQGEFHFNNQEDIKKIYLFNLNSTMLGKYGNVNSLKLNDLPSGIYFIKFALKDGSSKLQKIIIR